MNRVTATDGCTEGYNKTEIVGYTTFTFMEKEGFPNL
jgi:hypothetical protein